MPRGRKKTTTTKKPEIVIEDNSVVYEVDNSSDVIADEIDISTDEPEIEEKQYKDHDLIKCHSCVIGGLTITCKSGNYYYFNDYGAEIEIEYKDLSELVRTHSDHIFNPRIIVDDAELVSQFKQLSDFYEKSYTTKNLKDILNLPINKMVSVINDLPDGVKNNLCKIAAKMIHSGELDSLQKLKALDKIYNTDMVFLASLNDTEG